MTESQPTPLVVTFTANPSIDRTIALDAELRRGEVQRAVSITEQAAGKGINVARVVAASGYQVSAVCAGLDEQYSMLAARSAEPLPIQGIQLGAGQHVRGNTTVTEPSGVTTKLNGPGPVLSANQVAEASLLLMDAAEGASWVALSGSLPPGAPVDWYARLVDGLHATGAKIAVDTSDASLDAVLAALPVGSFDLIKPNSDELAQLTGGDAAAFERAAKAGELDEIVDAATALHARGIANVLVTLGGSGAVLVTAEGARGRLVGRRVHPRRCGGQVVVRGLGQRGRVRLGGSVPARHHAASSRRSARRSGGLHPAAIALPTPAAGAVVLAGSCSRHPHPPAHKNARRKSVRFRWNASELTYGERLLRTASVCYGRRASG